MKPRVLVAMSGGVEAPSAAALLHEQGPTSSASRCALRGTFCTNRKAPRHLLLA